MSFPEIFVSVSGAAKRTELPYQSVYKAVMRKELPAHYAWSGWLIPVAGIDDWAASEHFKRADKSVQAWQKDRQTRERAQAVGLSQPPRRTDTEAFGRWLSECRARGLTYKALAEVVGVSQERVKQLLSGHERQRRRADVERARSESSVRLESATESLALALEYIACGVDRRQAYRRDRALWGHLDR
jgi:hypothetical protein